MCALFRIADKLSYVNELSLNVMRETLGPTLICVYPAVGAVSTCGTVRVVVAGKRSCKPYWHSKLRSAQFEQTGFRSSPVGKQQAVSSLRRTASCGDADKVDGGREMD